MVCIGGLAWALEPLFVVPPSKPIHIIQNYQANPPKANPSHSDQPIEAGHLSSWTLLFGGRTNFSGQWTPKVGAVFATDGTEKGSAFPLGPRAFLELADNYLTGTVSWELGRLQNLRLGRGNRS